MLVGGLELRKRSEKSASLRLTFARLVDKIGVVKRREAMRVSNSTLPPTKSHKIRGWSLVDFGGRDQEADAILAVHQDKDSKQYLLEETTSFGFPVGTRSFLLVRHLQTGEVVKPTDDLEHETRVGPRYEECSCKGFRYHKHCVHCDSLRDIIKQGAISEPRFAKYLSTARV